MRSAPGASARNLVGPLLRATYRIRVTGAHHLPVTGGVLVMATGEGVLDPALLATSLRRPIAVMVGRGAPPGPLGHALGRISVKDDEPGAALRQAVEELRNAGAVGCFPLGLPGRRSQPRTRLSRRGCGRPPPRPSRGPPRTVWHSTALNPSGRAPRAKNPDPLALNSPRCQKDFEGSTR